MSGDQNPMQGTNVKAPAPARRPPVPPGPAATNGVPAGFVLVPVEPTPEMCHSAEAELDAGCNWPTIYAAMLAAAPAAPAPRNTATHEHLSTMIGMVLGARQRGKMEYLDGSVMHKAVEAAVEHLQDWPHPEAAPAAPAQAPMTDSELAFFIPEPVWSHIFGGRREALWDLKRVRQAMRAAIEASRRGKP